MIVGLSGWKGSGKDLASDILVEEFRFKKISFAKALKDMVSEQYNIPRNSLDNRNLKEAPLFQYPVNPQDDFSKAIVDLLNKEFRPDGNGNLYWTPRALAILEGSIKRSVNPEYWTNKVLAQIKPDDLAVITDLRYKSEAHQIRNYATSIGANSCLIRINRFDESQSDDPSERDLDDYEDFDIVIENRGTIEEFKEKILNFVFSKL
jgi:hypothetical protein